MRMNVSAVLLCVASATTLSAHVMVSPPQSKAGASQKYEVRVHNEAKVAATSIELDIPPGVTVVEVTKPTAGTFTTRAAGDRVTVITWQVRGRPAESHEFAPPS